MARNIELGGRGKALIGRFDYGLLFNENAKPGRADRH